ncbi:MAG: hypothetical protein R3208_18205 [Ketobacteraceae bacterium]|nr:hypothetical protein [Ketobacteraceae bacterium]
MRTAITFILLCVVGSANAVNEIPSALTLQLAESIESLSRKLEYCRENEKTLNSEKIKSLGLERDELKIVLAYQFSRLHFECSRREYVDYLIATRAFNEYASQSGKEMMQKLDKIIASSEKYRWDAIEKYNALPQKIQKRVEESRLFNEPFNLLDSLPLVSSND